MSWQRIYGSNWQKMQVSQKQKQPLRSLFVINFYQCFKVSSKSPLQILPAHISFFSLPPLLPPLSFPSCSSPPFPHHSPPVYNGVPPPIPLHPLRSCQIQLGVWAVSSPTGSEAEPQPQSNLVHFSLKRCHLVATNLKIFLRIDWPNKQ